MSYIVSDKSVERVRRRSRFRWLKRIGWGLLGLLLLALCTWGGWHYSVRQRLNETLAEMDHTDPGWRLEDIEAAREQIPEEENSARVVVASTKLLPRNWPPQEFDLFVDLRPNEQLSPEDFLRLKRELKLVRPALEEARKLAAMPRGRHRITYQRYVYGTLMTDQADGRRISRLLVLDAVRYDRESDPKNALLSCRAAFNTARALGDEPLGISQLLRTAGVVAACQAVERTLAQGEPAAAELMALQKLLDNEDAFPDLVISARGERAAGHATFDAIESGDVSMAELEGGHEDGFQRLLAPFFRDTVRAEHSTMLAMMSRWVAIAQSPMPEQAEAERQFDREIRALSRTAGLTRALLPALTKLGEASRRKHAHLRCLNAALAAECYRQARKRWPESLDKLCPKYLAAVPLDPFDGQTLRYHRLEDGVMIYSVGNDGVDDGGNLDREHPNQPGADVGSRLWDVTKRRLPPQFPNAG